MIIHSMLAEINYAKAVVPALIVGFFIGMLFIVWAMTKRYRRIPPNAIGVIYGKRRTQITGPDGQKSEVGFKLVSGGAVFIWPIVEEYAEMSTEAFQIEISEDNIPSKKNVGVTVSGVATCRISPIPEEQMNAVQNFLGKTLEEIKGMIGQILRGHLRSIVGGLEVEELLRERSKFNEMVVKECSPELSRMGIRILTLVIQDVKDKEGYIDALGKQAVAIAKRDAQIATAEAERETKVKTSDAIRTAAEVTAQNDALIKEAEKKRDIQVAQFRLETATKQAEADMAGPQAKTRQEQILAVLEAQRDSAATEARTKVQELEAQRKQKELEATTIVIAQATAKASVIKSEGERSAATVQAEARKKVAELNADTARLEAEGHRNALILEGEGEGKKLQTIAEAQAIATQKTKTAEAEGERASLLAQADGTKAARLAEAAGREQFLLAEAKGKQSMLLAEADGADKMAEAMKKLSEQGKLILVLDRLPHLLEVGGEAGQKIAKAVFDPIGVGVSKIGNVTITDLGGGNTAKNGLSAIGNLVPQIVVDFFTQAKARGIDLTELLKALKMDPAQLTSMLNPIAESQPSKDNAAETADSANRTSAPKSAGDNAPGTEAR
jgi:flotillin